MEKNIFFYCPIPVCLIIPESPDNIAMIPRGKECEIAVRHLDLATRDLGIGKLEVRIIQGFFQYGF